MDDKDYKKRYEEALEVMRQWVAPCHTKEQLDTMKKSVFPELKESEDERIRRLLIKGFENYGNKTAIFSGLTCGEILSWLEKQGEHKTSSLFTFDDVLALQSAMENAQKTDEELYKALQSLHNKVLDTYHNEKQGEDNSISPEEMNKSIGRRIAISLINYLDDNRYEGAMNMSSMECEDLKKSILDSDWSKVYRYMQKKLEKQGEQKPIKNIVETWKDMRLEVYLQASGNRHEPNYSDDTTKMFSLNDIDEIIEKMSEQKPTDEIKPKFKVGDWVVNGNEETAHIVKVGEDSYGTLRYYIEWANGNKSDPMPCFIDDDFHLWTIQDAKDGDVLVWDDNDCIPLFKNIYDEDSFNGHGFVGHCTNVFEPGLSCHDIEGAHPANKEQRDLLFSKMKEAGYEWDAKKKKLMEIGQKSAWSEEDERLCLCLIEDQEEALDKVDNDECGHSEIISDLKETYNERIDWLKSIKDRVQL